MKLKIAWFKFGFNYVYLWQFKRNDINKHGMKDMRLLYTDEENDQICIGSDDEYKEFLKVAKTKNDEGLPMVIKCIRRSNRKESKKNDVLGRDCKNSPGKVTKSSPTKLRPKVSNKPISLTIKYRDDEEVKELSRSLERTKLADEVPEESVLRSPSNKDIRKQQASVFDWMTSKEKTEEVSPPSWFSDFMENFKEELVAEVSAKVVQSLGVVIDNKLSCLEMSKKHQEPKQVEKVLVGSKVKKPSRDNEKVKKEAMRMSMQFNEDAESKELKKLRKALAKKTDKVVKIAMKIEKKQNQEDKKRKPSISSSAGPDLGGMKIPIKKDKKCRRKRSKKTKESVETETESDCVVYPVLSKPAYPLSPVRDYPLVPVVQNYPLVKADDTKVSVLDKILSGHLTLIKDIVAENMAARTEEADQAVKLNEELVEITINEGKLVNAVFVSETPKYMKVAVGGSAMASVKVTNMGCLKWTEEVSAQQIIASDKLAVNKKIVSLEGLNPGDEQTLEFQFQAPAEPGLYESVWNFFDGNERFGPPLIFKMIVAANDDINDPSATEMKDYNTGVEMKSIGISATSQEMVELSKKEKPQESEDEDSDDDDSECEEDEENEGFDLLATEVDTLALEESQQSKESEEFEVIPIPACFDLEVPFEIVDNQSGDQELCDMRKKDVRDTPLKKATQEKVVVEEKTVAISLPTQTQNIEKLVKLGFADRAKNLRLLELHQDDFEKVVKKLYEENNLDWAAIRH